MHFLWKVRISLVFPTLRILFFQCFMLSIQSYIKQVLKLLNFNHVVKWQFFSECNRSSTFIIVKNPFQCFSMDIFCVIILPYFLPRVIFQGTANSHVVVIVHLLVLKGGKWRCLQNIQIWRRSNDKILMKFRTTSLRALPLIIASL